MFQYKMTGSVWIFILTSGITCSAQQYTEGGPMTKRDTANHIEMTFQDSIRDCISSDLPIFFNYSNVKKYIFQNLSYPDEAIRSEITGTVLVGFTITREGKIDSIQLIRSVHPLLDTEALRLIQNMPQWRPVLLFGKPTPFSYKIPVIFDLK